MSKALSIASTESIYEVHMKAPLLMALNIMGGRRGIYRLTVVDDDRLVKGVISGLHVLDFVLGGRGEGIKRKTDGKLDFFLNEPVQIFMEEYIHKLPEDFKPEYVVNYIVENRVGHIVLVNEKSHLTGIITEHCIISRIPEKTFNIKASDIMSSPVHTLTTDNTVMDAVKLMAKQRIRRIPIVEDNEIKAMALASDIIRSVVDAEYHIEALIEKRDIREYADTKLGELKLTKPKILSPEMDVAEIIRIVKTEETCGCLIMSRDKKLVGIATDRDIVTKIPRIMGIGEFTKLITA